MTKALLDKKVKAARKLQATQKPIRTVSKAKLHVKLLYRNAAAMFLADAKECPVAAKGILGCYGIHRIGTEVHHIRGRLGKLLLDERYWLAVSAEGHRWIHDHPEEAREHGWLCEKGDWNKQV